MENYEATAEHHASGEDSGNNHGLPRAMGTIARLAYARAKAARVDVEPLLGEAHLTAACMEDSTCPLRVRDQIHFLDLVADALHDDYFGLHLAQIPDLREFGLLYYVLASADTLSDALKRVAGTAPSRTKALLCIIPRRRTSFCRCIMSACIAIPTGIRSSFCWPRLSGSFAT
jgi:hypothetical protein